MSDEAAFLEALKANPADDTARLVYADWLDENDQPQKAQYLRAVVDLARLPGGTPEYTDAAVRLYTACAGADGVWRDAAGARFDLRLDGYVPACKINAIKIIRERINVGLAEAKALAESAPTPLLSWIPFEVALPHALAFDLGRAGRPISVSVRPTPWPDAAPGAVFDVLLCELHPPPYHYGEFMRRGVAALLGVAPHDLDVRFQKLPLVVGEGLPPAAVAEFVRRLKLACNVGTALPPGAIRVVPRAPTT